MCFWTLKNHKSIWSTEIFFQNALHDIDVYRYRYWIGIGRYEKSLIGNLSDQPICKRGFICIGRYEKKLICCTLLHSKVMKSWVYQELVVKTKDIFLLTKMLIKQKINFDCEIKQSALSSLFFLENLWSQKVQFSLIPAFYTNITNIALFFLFFPMCNFHVFFQIFWS